MPDATGCAATNRGASLVPVALGPPWLSFGNADAAAFGGEFHGRAAAVHRSAQQPTCARVAAFLRDRQIGAHAAALGMRVQVNSGAGGDSGVDTAALRFQHAIGFGRLREIHIHRTALWASPHERTGKCLDRDAAALRLDDQFSLAVRRPNAATLCLAINASLQVVEVEAAALGMDPDGAVSGGDAD